MITQVSEQAEKDAWLEYKSTITPDNRIVRDDIITPRGMAMKLMGYHPTLHESGCILTGTCKDCNGTTFQYRMSDVDYWDCPRCKNVSLKNT